MLRKFKHDWEIDYNWQLIFPLLGIAGLVYSSYRLVGLISIDSLALRILSSIVIAFVLLKITLFIFKKLESKWVVERRWEMIRIFIVFAITGSTSALVSKPLLQIFGITTDNLNIYLYYFLYIFVSLIVYQFLLVFFGWALGQFHFFWEFEKKMLRRMGFSRFLD